MLQKRHFITFAATVKALPVKEREAQAGIFVAMCRADNPRFDESRFRKACGL